MDDSFDKNSHYFLNHILPWIALVLCVIVLAILVYHCRKRGECDPRSKKKDELKTHLTSDLV